MRAEFRLEFWKYENEKLVWVNVFPIPSGNIYNTFSKIGGEVSIVMVFYV